MESQIFRAFKGLAVDVSLQLKRVNLSLIYQEIGDINDVLWTPADIAALKPGVLFYYVHVTGVPDIYEPNVANIRRMLIERDFIGTGIIDEEGVEGQKLRNSCVWSVPGGALPPAMLATLDTDGELIETWENFRPYVQQKLDLIPRDDEPGNPSYNPAMHAPLTHEDLINA